MGRIQTGDSDVMFRTNKLVLAAGAAAASFSLSTFSADARNQINIVGSSTVFRLLLRLQNVLARTPISKPPLLRALAPVVV